MLAVTSRIGNRVTALLRYVTGGRGAGKGTGYFNQRLLLLKSCMRVSICPRTRLCSSIHPPHIAPAGS